MHQSLHMMLQRIKAVETARFDSTWSTAKHLELVPDSRVSAVPSKERRAAAASERADMKTLKSLVVNGASSQNPRRSSGRLFPEAGWERRLSCALKKGCSSREDEEQGKPQKRERSNVHSPLSSSWTG
eukprot:6477618-Amphidinium_carterae.4